MKHKVAQNFVLVSFFSFSLLFSQKQTCNSKKKCVRFLTSEYFKVLTPPLNYIKTLQYAFLCIFIHISLKIFLQGMQMWAQQV